MGLVLLGLKRRHRSGPLGGSRWYRRRNAEPAPRGPQRPCSAPASWTSSTGSARSATQSWGSGRKPPPSDSGLVVKAIHEHPGVAMTNSVCNSCPDSTRPPGPATDRYRDHRTFEQVVGSELVRFHAVGRVERRGATGVRRAGFLWRAERTSSLAPQRCVVYLAARGDAGRRSGLRGSLPRPPSRQDGARQNLAVACEPDRSYAPHIEEGELAAPHMLPRGVRLSPLGQPGQEPPDVGRTGRTSCVERPAAMPARRPVSA